PADHRDRAQSAARCRQQGRLRRHRSGRGADVRRAAGRPAADGAPDEATERARAAASTGSPGAAHRAGRCRGRRRPRRGGRRCRGGAAEALMKARTVGVNASVPAVVGVEVAVLAAILIFPPARWSWWPTATTAVVAILVLMLTVYRRNAIGWFADRIRWR